MQVIVNDLAVSYDKRGEGPVIVLLHGWGDRKETFDQLCTQLASRFTLVSIDLPGFGGSQPPSSAWGLEDYALQLRDILLKIAINPSTVSVLLGHSNGGAIAVTAVAKHYIAPRRLILLASSGIRNSNAGKKSLYKIGAKTGKLATLLLPPSKRKALKARYYEKIGSDLLVVPGMEATYRKIIKEDIVAYAEKIDVPTLLIYGELDTSTPPAHGMVLQHAIVGSELRVIQGGGHFVHHDRLQAVLAYMKEFLS